jgi:tetratricopeptide (TPR) repeat protein
MEVDRNYALAYSGLADCYALQCSAFYSLQQPTQVMPRAKAAVENALLLNDTLAEVHASLANIQLTYEWNWEAAEASFKRAIALDPKCAHVHHWYSHYLMIVGDADAAYEETHKALEIDPHDLTYNQHLGWYYLFTDKYDEAIKHLRAMIEQDPDFYPAHIILGIAYADNEMYPEAIEEFLEARRLEDRPPTLSYLGNVYARMGDKKKAREMLNELKKRSRQEYVSAYCMAMISIGLENFDEAFQYLDDAYHEHSEWLCWVKVNRVLDPIRSDPRFKKLLNRLAIPRTSHYSSL